MTDNAQRRNERTLMIDADDTLWENNIYYLRCTRRFQEFMAAWGCAPDLVQETLEECERATIARMGYGPEGYVESVCLACERMLVATDHRAEVETLAQARRLVEPILTPPMVVLPGVAATLRALRPTSRLVLVTKGDQIGQTVKLERSGLAPHFDAVHVVPEKDASTYRTLADQLQVDPKHTWMIGNSPRSDINPAVAAGLGAILIPHDHTWTAEHEQIENPLHVIVLESFEDLIPCFGLEAEAEL
ncbi:MAG: HAD family hydrolase [Anaerolineae bacterium]